jgi:AraC-like DNA-binding protein
MSRTAFANHVKQKTGYSPGRHLTQWRTHKTTKLLRAGQASIARIAEAVNYQPKVAFRKAYRPLIGNSLGKVRREAIYIFRTFLRSLKALFFRHNSLYMIGPWPVERELLSKATEHS